MTSEQWEVSHKGGVAWWADRGNTALGPFENRDVAAMVVNNLNDVLHLDHKPAAEYWIDRAVTAEAQLATATAALADMTKQRDELVFQIDVIAVAEPGWKANHVMRMAKFAADGINTHWDVVAQEKEKAILATTRAEKAEAALAEAERDAEMLARLLKVQPCAGEGCEVCDALARHDRRTSAALAEAERYNAVLAANVAAVKSLQQETETPAQQVSDG